MKRPNRLVWLACSGWFAIAAVFIGAAKPALADEVKKPAAGETTKIVLIGHGADHAYRTHTYLPDCELLAKCLRQTPHTEAVVSDGWPADPAAFDGVQAVVLHVKLGGDLLFHVDHRDQAAALIERGLGVAAIHWGTGATPNEIGERFLQVMGGHFHADFARYLVAESTMRPADQQHPVCRGWHDYPLREEYYIKLRFLPGAKPVAMAKVEGEDYAIGWTYERPKGGGRSFGFVGGHFHDNFANDHFRRTVVNGILWAAHREIPAEGAACKIEPKDLDLSGEFEKLKPKQ